MCTKFLSALCRVVLTVLLCLCCVGIGPANAAHAADPQAADLTYGSQGPVTITVSAAASLTDAFNELKGLFETAHAIVTVAMNFAASGPLLRQIEMGAPVDVFASADEVTMDRAAAADLIYKDKRVTFAANSLVLVAPANPSHTAAPSAPDAPVAPDAPDASGSAAAVDFLTAPTTQRLALGNPESVPAGRYAKTSLESLGLWESLTPKYVMGANVRQVLDYVSRGEVEAGIVYATDVNRGIQDGKIALVATLTGHAPVTYPMAPCKNLAASPEQAAWAQAFVDFVMSAEGQAVLAAYGFGGA